MPKTEVVKVNPANPEPENIKKAAGILKKGGIAAFSTETVYGVGAILSNKAALDKLHEIKNRPKKKPFTVAISNLAQLDKLGCEVSSYGRRLINRFWPGPLTLILWTHDEKKVGVRIPDDAVALALLKEIGSPLALPSANISGNPDPVTAQDVLKDLDGKIEIVLDSGKTRIGTSSTVLNLTVSPYSVLRKGAIGEEEIKKVPEKFILFVCTGNSCRSVMAEGFLRQLLKEKSKNGIEVASAGVAGFSGYPPTDETILVMKEEGIDVKDSRSTPLTQDLVNRVDLILAMQNIHVEDILNKAPQAKNKVYLLREFTKDNSLKTGLNLEIPDPISQPMPVYKRVSEVIKRNVKKLAEMI